jgi:ATP-dependent helicase/nuclease subunit B
VPGVNEARIGFSPQLTLEAAMVKRGAFAKIDATRPTALIYVKLMDRDGGTIRDISRGKTEIDPDVLTEAHYDEFVSLIDAHWNRGRPFYSRPAVQFLRDAKPYDHLARVREWTIIGDAENGGDE